MTLGQWFARLIARHGDILIHKNNYDEPAVVLNVEIYTPAYVEYEREIHEDDLDDEHIKKHIADALIAGAEAALAAERGE